MLLLLSVHTRYCTSLHLLINLPKGQGYANWDQQLLMGLKLAPALVFKYVLEIHSVFVQVLGRTSFSRQKSLFKRTHSTYSKLNAKCWCVKHENCHFPNKHFNFSHVTLIQGIIQAVLFGFLHACQFIWQPSDMLGKKQYIYIYTK